VDYEEFSGYQEADDDSPTEYVDLRQEVFGGLIGDEVTKALNELPVDFKTVILLCDVEDFSYEEIAAIVDIPIGTVRSRLHRARNILKEKLRNYAENEGYQEKR